MSKIKQKPDVDGFYWYRYSKEASFKIVLVSDNSYQKIGFETRNTIYSGEWIGPLMPDCVDIYVSKQI